MDGSGTGQLAIASARGRWVLLATVLGSAVASLDATVVGIALPRIGEDFGTGVGALQWVVTGYTLTLAAFLLLGGSIGDRFGRRRTFLVGIVWFALASALCALAPSASVLIACRVLQGVGAALLTPGSLAILQASVAPEDRARAIGAWSGLSGLSTAAGPLVGGALLSVASWRWVFLLNLPLSATVVVVGLRHVPESVDPAAPRHLDVAGAATAVAGLGALTFALIEGPTLGWTSAAVLAAAAGALVFGAGFVVVERRGRAPMLPLGLFGARQFAAANAVTLFVYAALGGALFLLPIALQQVAGYSPLGAGLALLPVSVLMLGFSARAGRLAAAIGPRLPMTLGPLLAAGGLALLARVTSVHGYAAGVLPGASVLGVGLVLTVAPLTATAMSAAPTAHAGLASAVNNDVARTAGLLAVAVLPFAAGLGGDAYLHPATFASGFTVASALCAGLCALGGVVAWCTVRNPRPAAPCTPAGAPAPALCAPTVLSAGVGDDG